MANKVPKVSRGQRLSFRANHWNAFADAANAHIERQLAGGAGRSVDHWRQGAIVPVRNNSGGDLDRYAVLGIGGPIFGVATPPDDFTREVAVTGTTPDEDSHVGRFVVLQEAIRSNRVGRGMIVGVTPVRIYVEDADEDRFADVCDGVTGYLTTGASGSAHVLYRETQGTGEQWAYVLLGTPNWFNSDGDEYEVWQLQDIGGGVLRPKWDYVRMHE